MNYLPRLADQQLSDALKVFGGVLIEGPRGCGKTKSAEQAAATSLYLDTDLQARLAISNNVTASLQGPFPMLIDEWQVEPAVWNMVRHEIDQSGAKGRYILTGSVTPPVDSSRHSGALRIQRIKMRPMTLQESGLSNGSFSVSKKLAGQDGLAQVSGPKFDFNQMIEHLCVGGWPNNQSLNAKQGLLATRSYLRDLFDHDFEKYIGTFNADTAKFVLREVARTIGANTSVEKMAQQISISRGPTKAETVQAYLEQLGRLHIVEQVSAWNATLRSRYSVNKAPKRYLVDPSLVVAALGANPTKLTNDLNTTGFIFENLVMRDLASIVEVMGGQLFHYRDESQLEVDAVIEDSLGNWAALEIKLGAQAADQAATNLCKFADRVDQEACGAPAFLGVVTNSDLTYQRNDGVYVIGLNTLGI